MVEMVIRSDPVSDRLGFREQNVSGNFVDHVGLLYSAELTSEKKWHKNEAHILQSEPFRMCADSQ